MGSKRSSSLGGQAPHITRGPLSPGKSDRSFRRRVYDSGDFLKMLREQNGLCALCGKVMERPVVDHDHETDAIRSLLHPNCNLLLGLAEDNPDNLIRAAAYLIKWKTN
jgi:recombination endonuclease VII